MTAIAETSDRIYGPCERPGENYSPGTRVEAERVAPLIRAFVDRVDRETEGMKGGVDRLSFASGLPQRTIYRILHHDSYTRDKRGRVVVNCRTITVDTLDRLLDGLGRSELLYCDPENADRSDGFRDVYFHDAIVGDEATAAAEAAEAAEAAKLVAFPTREIPEAVAA